MKKRVTDCIVLFTMVSLLTMSISLLEIRLPNGNASHTQTLAVNEPKPINKSNIFAISKSVDITPDTFGDWVKAEENGYLRWTYTVREKATSLNFGFSEFVLPPSAKFEICNENNTSCQEFLPKKNNQHHLQQWTPILKGDVAKFSLRVLAREKDLLRLRLTDINKGIEKNTQHQTAQECLIDIVCAEAFPQINDFEEEIQSVGLITIEGTRICTGVLLNNVRQDFTPYFLTARHCGITAENAASVVVHWNYQNTTCRLGLESNKVEGDGSLAQFNAGATFLAALQRSDFTLLRLNEPVAAEANAYFAGWNATSIPPIDVTTVHHANTEEKRITFGAGKTTITRHFGEETDPGLNHIRVQEWNISSTASGSSGGPLFDDAHRVVGQLHGGLAACGNQESDWFGRLHTSWLGDSIPERQLKNWLDPDDSGIEMLNGTWDELTPLALQIGTTQVSEINCFGDSTGAILIDIINGSGPYRYSIDGGETFRDEALFQNLPAGQYELLVRDANESSSGIIPFDIEGPEELVFSFEQAHNQVSLLVEGGVPPYLFSRDNLITFDSVFSNLPQGISSFQVTDANACTQVIEIDLAYSVFQAQTNIVNPISCFDSQDGKISIVHSGTVGPYQYRLNNGPLLGGNVFDDLLPGVYVGTVIDSLGNQVSTASINLEAPIELSAVLRQVEENIIVEVTGGVAPYLFQYDSAALVNINQFSILDGIAEIIIFDANGCQIVMLNTLTSATNIALSQSLFLYPNPAKNWVYIDLKQQRLSAYTITDTQGIPVSVFNFESEVTGNLKIDVSNLNTGIYFFTANLQSRGTKTLKFTVL